jgi:hypothetical protein
MAVVEAVRASRLSIRAPRALGGGKSGLLWLRVFNAPDS